ncbi:CsiV family protein [Thalassotalea fusca]
MRNKRIQLLSLLAAIIATNSPVAQADRWSGKWFEVEVILLSQLADKSTIREHFDEAKPLPKYRRFYDLLSPYLQPDIASLKQVLPLCSDGKDPLAALAAMPKLPSLFEVKTLKEIEQLPVLPQEEADTDTDLSADNNFTHGELTAENSPVINTLSEQAQLAESDQTSSTDEVHTDITPEVAPIEEGLTPEQQMWLAAAEEALDPIQLNYSKLVEPFPASFCVLTRDQFNQLDVNPARYSYNGFLIEAMPRWIDGVEDTSSTQPYLLSRESLKLQDIVKQLSRSRDFRPILHLGWRQQAYELSKATPVRLSAGDNLQANFVKQVEQYLADKKALEQQEAQLASIFENGTTTPQPLTNNVDSKALQTAQHINKVLQQFPGISPENTPIETLATLQVNDVTQHVNDESLLDAPQTPVQPWYLDGFFRIHLNQNFLNITADFNILNLTLAQQATLALQPENDVELAQIHFSQTRRIISREIHYFDHPYMGMIVQVRRYDKPIEEANSGQDLIEE